MTVPRHMLLKLTSTGGLCKLGYKLKITYRPEGFENEIKSNFLQKWIVLLISIDQESIQTEEKR